MKLTGKRIIVTGAASGIGQQSAKIMQEQGATIVAFDRNKPSAYVDEYIHVDFKESPNSVQNEEPDSFINSISSGVEMRPNTALRCGNRPNRSIISLCRRA